MTVTLRRMDAAQWRQEVRGRRGFAVPALDAEDSARLAALFERPVNPEEAVAAIVADVRERGDAAVRDWTRRLDGVEVATPSVPASDLDAALAGVDPKLRSALEQAAARIREFHSHQADGRLRGTPDRGLRPAPLRRAGCYVPGGRAAYPSTVLMDVIPAQVAGVESVVIASPPGPGGRPHPLVLAAARLLGVAEVYGAGGVQAVAALAYGTESLRPVDKIVGPGNLFVTLAKRAVFGAVGIDGLAGPSEVLVVASEGAVADWVAADLVSQLEHDPLAWAVCISDSDPVIEEVCRAFAARAETAARAGIIAASAGRHGIAVRCTDMEEALELCDSFAPEHLELQGGAAEALSDRVRCAGAVFVGGEAPVSIGDYIAGPNHTLPTGGAARFSGPLTVMDFVRWSSVTRLDAAELADLSEAACTLAEAEGLHGHAAAIRARLQKAGV